MATYGQGMSIFNSSDGQGVAAGGTVSLYSVPAGKYYSELTISAVSGAVHLLIGSGPDVIMDAFNSGAGGPPTTPLRIIVPNGTTVSIGGTGTVHWSQVTFGNT